MCELTEVNYLDGDIVWVKLGPCWWPGEVWGEARLPEDALLGFKKLPIAVVKFFQEESFEYVKNVCNIYKYNCSKKDEFIKKGLDKFRAKNSFMEKFPSDLKKAEELTGGNPNIIDDAKYAPSPKLTYNDLYGSPVQKRKKTSPLKDGDSSPFSRLKPSSLKKNKDRSPISPMRTPNKSRISDITMSPYNTSDGSSPSGKYNCYICGYTSNRLNVIVIHTKQHSANLNNSSTSQFQFRLNSSKDTSTFSRDSSCSQSPSRVSGISRTTSTIMDDLKIICNSEKAEKKEKDKSVKGKMSPGITPKGKKRGRPSLKKKAEETAKKIKTDYEIKNKLLADWSDDQDSDHEKNKSTDNVEKDVANKNDEKAVNENNLEEGINASESRTSSCEKSEDDMKSKSCFDFEEDDVIDVIPKSPGRKIPRLITKKTKKEFEYTPEPADASRLLERHEEIVDSTEENMGETSVIDNNVNDDSRKFDIDDILNVTKPPELPEVPKDRFDRDVEVPSKPTREIMSPKERGKRIFKSKQIFKTRMQEKYGNDVKISDVDDVVVDRDKSGKDSLIISVDKSVSRHDEQDDIKDDAMPVKNDIESVMENDSESVEVLKIISETDEDKIDLISEQSKSQDIELNLVTGVTETGDVSDTSNLVDSTKITVSDVNDLAEIDNGIPQENNILEKVDPVEGAGKSNSDLKEEKLEDDKPDLLYNITSESLNLNKERPEVVKTPSKRRRSRHSAGESKMNETKSPVRDLVTEKCSLKSPTRGKKVNAVRDVETNQNRKQDEAQMSAEQIHDIIGDLIPSPKKKMKSDSTLNDAECLINFSDSAYTEKEKDKSKTKENKTVKEKIQEVHEDKLVIKENNLDVKENNLEFRENKPVIKDKSEVKESKSEVKESKSEVKDSKSEVKESKSEVKESKSEVKESKSEVKESKSEVKESKSEVKESKAEVKDSKLEVKDSKLKVKGNKKEIKEIENVIEENMKGIEENDMKIKDDKLEIKDDKPKVKDKSEIKDNKVEVKDKLEGKENKSEVEGNKSEIKENKTEAKENKSVDSKVKSKKSPRASPRKSSEFRIEAPGEKPTPVVFGFGSLDTTEPLKSGAIREASNDIKAVKKVEEEKTQAGKNIKQNNMDIFKPSEPKTEYQPESDIRSYIASKTETGKNTKSQINSRLQEILTESTIAKTDSPKSSRNIQQQRNRSPETRKIESMKSKKHMVIKMKNDKKEAAAAAANMDVIKSTVDQIENIEKFVIEKPKPRPPPTTEALMQPPKPVGKTEVKIVKKQARKPAIISSPRTPPVTKTTTVTLQEDAIFDINSMPIVLSDQLITAENLDQMSLVLSKGSADGNLIIDNGNLIIMDQTQEINKIPEQQSIKAIASRQKMQLLGKTVKPISAATSKLQIQQKANTATGHMTVLTKNQRIYQAPAAKTKLVKNSAGVLVQQPTKTTSKFIVIPASAAAVGTKYTVGKRNIQQKNIVAKVSNNETITGLVQTKTVGGKGQPKGSQSKAIVQKVVHQKVNIDSSGNTVLFITNSNGEQSKVVLTPDQKIPGMQSSLTPQTIVTSKGMIINPKQTNPVVATSKSNQLILTSKGQIIARTGMQPSAAKPALVKQKNSNVTQTILTSKGSIITSSTQVVQPAQQLVMSKGNILTQLTANQMKQLRSQNPNKKIVIHKKTNLVMQPQQSGLAKDQTTAINKVIQNATSEVNKSGNLPMITKGFVKLTMQQLADMEKLGFVEETDHGKVISQEGVRRINFTQGDVPNIQPIQQQKKLVKATLKKVPPPVPGVIDHNAAANQRKRTQMLLNKQQPALPPLTPIGESKKSIAKETARPKAPEPQLSNLALEQVQTSEQLLSQTISNAVVSQEETVTAAAADKPLTEANAAAVETTLTALPETTQLLAVPGETFGGPLGSFLLCSVGDSGNLTPVDNQPLYLDANNQLVPASGLTEAQLASVTSAEETPVPEQSLSAPITEQLGLSLESLENQQIIINADGQQFILDQQSLLALTEQQILTTDGQQLIIQGDAQQILAALAANQEATILDENALAAAASSEEVPYQHDFSGNKDILATALANTNVFQNESANSDLDMFQNLQQDYKHSTVSETSTALSQPIMSPLELPSKKPEDNEGKIEGMNFNQNIDDSLAVIGVNSANVPTSLDLPITITNPKIAPKSTNPLNMACEMIYQSSSYSPVTSKELATADIFQTSPQQPDMTISEQSTILHSGSNDVVTTLSMPDLTGEVADSEMILNRIDTTEQSFPAESMPLLSDDNETSTKELPSTMKPENIEYTELLPSEIVAPTTSQHNEEPREEHDGNNGIVDLIQSDLNVSETNTNKILEEIPIPDIIATTSSITDISLESSQIETTSTKSESAEPAAESGKDTAEADDIERQPNKDSEAIQGTSDQICPLQVSEKTEDTVSNAYEDVSTTDSVDKAFANDICTNNIENAILSENERKSKSQVATTEINVVTSDLNLSQEVLLTPETIPETSVSPRALIDPPHDFCESSNSCDIPIQPSLVYDRSQEESRENGSQEETTTNENESDTHATEPPLSMFDFDTR